MVVAVGDVDVASKIDRHPERVVELGECAVGAAECAGAGVGGDHSEEAFDGCVVVVVETVDDRAG